MDDKKKQEVSKNRSTEKKKPKKVDIDKAVIIDIQDEAGPSEQSHEHLPGSVSSPKPLRTGLSKSEHSLANIITRQDVANALKLTSLSFGTGHHQPIKNINFKDLKIPSLEKDTNSKNDSETMMDLRKFMASCFKFSKESPAINSLPEVPVRIVSTIQDVQELPNRSCDVQTEKSSLQPKANEVIITNPQTQTIEAKISRGEEKKKISSLSDKSDLGLSNRDSLSSIGSNVCRICMTRGRERLISPCNCKGSLANVHLSCLERWLNQVGRNHCELCGFSYPAIRTPRYTVLQALRLWFGNPRNRSHLQSDCLIFWLLSTVTAGLLAVCIVGTQYFVIEGNKFGKTEFRKEEDIFTGISHRITETAMDFFMAVVLCGYSVTVYLLWKDHYVMWNRWRRANVNVRLLLSPDTSVPFVPRPRYNIV